MYLQHRNRSSIHLFASQISAIATAGPERRILSVPEAWTLSGSSKRVARTQYLGRCLLPSVVCIDTKQELKSKLRRDPRHLMGGTSPKWHLKCCAKCHITGSCFKLELTFGSVLGMVGLDLDLQQYLGFKLSRRDTEYLPRIRVRRFSGKNVFVRRC